MARISLRRVAGMKASGLRSVVGVGVIVAAVTYLVATGVSQSVVYFVTPGELVASPAPGKAYRVGGRVEPGSLRWDPRSLELSFRLTDAATSVEVRHRGAPPDLFGEGRGAVVEGTWQPDGHVRATQILAKHSEEYQVPARPDR